MRHVAFLTLEDRAGYVIDDAIAVEHLARRGCEVDEIPWRTEGVRWGDYDGVVIRTTWDYQRDLDGFLAALARIEESGAPLANDLATVRWNARKTYLRDLASRGVRIVPTRWGAGVSIDDLRDAAQDFGPLGGVIKPVVSANADDTFRVDRATPTEVLRGISETFAGRDWMIQPFVARVLDEGEVSVFYFGGEASHAVVKRPRAGDFRVQEEHGGIITPLPLDPALLTVSDRVMASLDRVPLQARVDLVRLDDGSLALMELEAIEPSLYFRTDSGAAGRFADALSRWLG